MAQTRAKASTNPAVANAVLVGAALVWGAALLVQRGRLTWPPYELLASISTLAGCLALVGPVILARSGELEGSLGELMWLVGGLLVWIFDIEGVMQGRWRTLHWATPLSDRAMGLTMLAVLVGRLEVRHGGPELVVDECHRLGLECFLGRHGLQHVVTLPGVARQRGSALILDGLDGDL